MALPSEALLYLVGITRVKFESTILWIFLYKNYIPFLEVLDYYVHVI